MENIHKLSNEEIIFIKKYIKNEKLYNYIIEEDEICKFRLILPDVRLNIMIYEDVSGKRLYNVFIQKKFVGLRDIETEVEYFTTFEETVTFLKYMNDKYPLQYFTVIPSNIDVYSTYFQEKEKSLTYIKNYCPFVDIDLDIKEKLEQDLDIILNVVSRETFGKKVVSLMFESIKGKYNILSVPTFKERNILNHIRFDITQFAYRENYWNNSDFEIRLYINEDVDFPQYQYVKTNYGYDGLLKLISNLIMIENIS
jgi:hypothetical protein